MDRQKKKRAIEKDVNLMAVKTEGKNKREYLPAWLIGGKIRENSTKRPIRIDALKPYYILSLPHIYEEFTVDGRVKCKL